MFGIGPEELVLILLLALLVLGPERLPKVARDIGRTVGDLRRTSDELRDEFLNADRYLEAPKSAGRPAETPDASASPAPDAETAFEREMREARERLRET
jgi:Tat protein translocase TatB subunit